MASSKNYFRVEVEFGDGKIISGEKHKNVSGCQYDLKEFAKKYGTNEINYLGIKKIKKGD